jgi:two-component system chemotaxis response regulator CheY
MEIKALVTDSNSKVRQNISRSLKEIGIRNIAEATDGRQAIEMLEKGKYDVVFAEWNTKTAKGEELVSTLRRIDAKMPIIVTAPQSKKLAELKQSCPTASDYLTTPFTTDQLKKTVCQCVPSIAG